jgi:hypothetical protein
VIGRCALFLAWAVVGAVASYGLPYALTPYGLMILGAAFFAGLALPEARGRRWPEALGLLAGPGVFLLYAASLSGDATPAIAGALFAGTALVAYTVAGRALCARDG